MKQMNSIIGRKISTERKLSNDYEEEHYIKIMNWMNNISSILSILWS